MARFDVYAQADSPVLLLDCQADLLEALATRLVVPLMRPRDERPAFARLNPVFDVNGERLEMITQGAASISKRALTRRVCSLASEQAAIMNAFDLLLTGY